MDSYCFFKRCTTVYGTMIDRKNIASEPARHDPSDQRACAAPRRRHEDVNRGSLDMSSFVAWDRVVPSRRRRIPSCGMEEVVSL